MGGFVKSQCRPPARRAGGSKRINSQRRDDRYLRERDWAIKKKSTTTYRIVNVVKLWLRLYIICLVRRRGAVGGVEIFLVVAKMKNYIFDICFIFSVGWIFYDLIIIIFIATDI